jgi:hypothetical protein
VEVIMPRWTRTLLHPERYHGHGKRAPFFEGWYFKLVDASEAHRYAIIPAIFLHEDPGQRHAFIQILEGATGQASYHRFPADAFSATDDPFEVRIGPNRFSLNAIELDIRSDQQDVQGRVEFYDTTPWPIRLWSPGAMGPFAWLPFMQTYHGVLSLDHELRGCLTVGGEPISFDGGRGYTEKDWGRSFPAAWIWLQSNHFGEPGTSLTASVAAVPLGPLAFPGFIVALWHKGQLHRFTTYNGARIGRLHVSEQHVLWSLLLGRRRFELRASRAASTVLAGPSTSDMGLRVPESLTASVEVRLTHAQGNAENVVFEGTGRNAGLEVVGDLSPLLV